MDINKVKSEIRGPASLIMLPFDENLNSNIQIGDRVFKPSFKIIEKLNTNIKKEHLLIRFYPRDFGKSEFRHFENRFPEIKKDTVPMMQELNINFRQNYLLHSEIYLKKKIY